MFLIVFSWVVMLVTIVGLFMNIKKNPWSFVILGICNTSWITIDIYLGVYSQAALMGVYLIFCWYGFVEWQKHKILERDKLIHVRP